MGELIDMPFRIFHSLYRAAWQESEAKRIEAEQAEEEAKKEQQRQAKAKNANMQTQKMSSRAAMNASRGISVSDLDDVVDELN